MSRPGFSSAPRSAGLSLLDVLSAGALITIARKIQLGAATSRLKLTVNETKSAVARPQQRKFLGFSFTAGPEVKRVIAPAALVRFKQRTREITRRAKGVSLETTIAELAPYLPG